MLTRSEAIKKAKDRQGRTGGEYAVLARTDHPAFCDQTVYLVGRPPRKLSAGSRIVFRVGEDLNTYDGVRVVELSVVDRETPEYRWNGRRSYLTSTWKEYRSKPRIYVWPKGESVFENLCFREDRPYQAYRKALPLALEALGLPLDTKCRWNRHAGCSMCPCSPGFVVQIAEPICRDVHLTIEGVEQPVTERALGRGAQIAADPTLAGSLGLLSTPEEAKA